MRARLLGALAVLVLGVCGVVTARSVSPPASLAGTSHWMLATTLPTRAEVDPDWAYTLHGTLGYATPPQPRRPQEPAPSWPMPRFTPQSCGDLPDLVVIPGAAVARVTVDSAPRAPLSAAQPAMPASAATGFIPISRPQMAFRLWAVTDAVAEIAHYRRWLDSCRSYRATTTSRRETIATDIDTTIDLGADAAIAVTRTGTADGADPPIQHARYYAVRGLLLECFTTMGDDDTESMATLCARTVRKLQKL